MVPIAGLIRTAEVADGQPTYRQALAMSLTTNALSKSPALAFLTTWPTETPLT